MNYLIVFLGAGIGGTLRHFVNTLTPRLIAGEFPFHTLAVNILGSLLMGVLAGYFILRGHASEQLQLFLAVGVLGGFTTFSAFSLDAILLYDRGQPGAAAIYVIGSVILSIAGLAAGLAAMRRLLG